ncbi:hypothetical protein [Nitrospira tepida]|nr:hypothetical protein [Nitrospira tepida]
MATRLRSGPSMIPSITSRPRPLGRLAAGVTAHALILLLLAIMPFAAALGVHHELAAADHDGHEHSDSDLCQWVQHHTGQSVLAVVSPVQRFLVPCEAVVSSIAVHVESALIVTASPRAPPVL